jgi:AraC family transcriptional regulator, regulatory protein of adaptative response / DNA-3-methyladenine glycosylase II
MGLSGYTENMSISEAQADIFYKAMLARDYRFDGKFFVGVKTTGIYCRPICPARPKRQNVEFFSQALRAEQAGYRPCLRCHPECAPYSPSWSGQSPLIQRALQLIAGEEGALLQESDYAAQLGVSARHLRRLFQTEFGKTPKQIATTLRLNFARKLVVETGLPLTAVALNSGFASLRRFNTAFKERFERAPSELRKSKSHVSTESQIRLTLPYRPPYAWKTILDFYRRHQIIGLEQISSDSYARIFEIKGNPGWLKLTNNPKSACLELQLIYPETQFLATVVHRLRRMWDLDSDPLLISQAFANTSVLGEWSDSIGLRLPGSWDGFESAACIILGQMVSLQRAQTLISELLCNHGKTIIDPNTGESYQVFPSAESLAQVTDLNISTTRQRKQALKQLAQNIASGVLSLSPAQDPVVFRQQLLQIPGIGPWSSELIALRVLGDTDAFPSKDLILQRCLHKYPEIDLDKIKPWRGYAAISLWNQALKTNQKGSIYS